VASIPLKDGVNGAIVEYGLFSPRLATLLSSWQSKTKTNNIWKREPRARAAGAVRKEWKRVMDFAFTNRPNIHIILKNR